MKKFFVLFSFLIMATSFASDLYKCELSRENTNGIDQSNIKTGWLKTNTIGNILNLEALNGVSGVAIVTESGLKLSLCDEIKCVLSDTVDLGEYQGITSFKLYDSYRVSLECHPLVNETTFTTSNLDFNNMADNNCVPNCYSTWNTCLSGCRNLPSDDINSCYVGCNQGYEYCRARCN